MKQKRLITSALPYVNNVPHLGNIIGCVLSADVFARYSRLAGYNVRYICGTDEHGTATETKALEEGLTPQEICDKYHAIHKKVYDWFGCSFDAFGRTSTKRHTEITQSIFKKLNEQGYIKKGDVEQLWCPKCDKFLADRFVEGTCPKCGYERARGDQCDSCGNLLNATELISPVCKTCGSQPQARTTNHLFLDLPKLSPFLEDWANNTMEPGFWTQNAKTVTTAWFKEGLKERAISRDLKWGVPIPLEGYTDKVFYVWFDAPIGYISITANQFDDWEKWWKPANPSDVKLFQFMAKDNIPFHTIIFPASLLGTSDDWTMLHHIDSTEYLNYEDGKFSKSNNTGVFGDDAISTGIAPDVWRYYLLVNRPENSDTQFSWSDFQEKNNNELLANLGNFVNRTLTFIDRYFDGIVPSGELNKELWDSVTAETEKVKELMESVKLKDSLRAIMHISRLGNQYFQENAPWKLVKGENPGDKDKAGVVLKNCANLVKTLAVLINPFLPFTSGDIMHQLNAYKEDDAYGYGMYTDLDGHAINKPKPLFSKLETSDIDGWKQKFGGKKKDTSKKKSKEKKKKAALTPFETFPLKLKVGQITQVSDHPDADKLYVMRVDLGDEQRQIVAGLKAYFSKEDLVDRKIVVVTNLKPAKLRGVESQGMLLAGDGKVDVDGKKQEKVLTIDPKGASVGMDVYLESIETTDSKGLVDFEEFMKLRFSIKDKNVWCDNVDKRLRTEEDFVFCDLPDGSTVR